MSARAGAARRRRTGPRRAATGRTKRATPRAGRAAKPAGRARPGRTPAAKAGGRRTPGRQVRGGLERAARPSPGRDDTAVELRDIACEVHIGVDAEERANRQRVILDLALEGNQAGSAGTFCAGLADEVKRFLSEGRFVLIEATLLKLARLLFRRTRARRVTLRLRKFVLPETEFVAVEMAFGRGDLRR